jgi:methylated-DNA-protein-cysteine methyltransferase-like protein
MAIPIYYKQVYEIVTQIPSGHVTTYGAIADYLALGSARMVGFALKNCFTYAPGIPAHRVVNRLGVLSGRKHFNPAGTMEALLCSEGIHIAKHQVKSFEKFFLHPSEFVH